MPSRREHIAPTVQRILDATSSVGLGTERRIDLALAAAEALSNAVVHGNRLQPDALVSIRVDVVPATRAVVSVKDSGAGFDVSSLSDPTDPGRILVPGGRGVFLMRRLVDEVAYNAIGNEVRLTIERRRRRKGRLRVER
jgi:serine/threonine-protein kinase RsbW